MPPCGCFRHHRFGVTVSDVFDPYPFESDDDIEIGELDLESIDRFDDERITVGELVGETESWRFGHVIVDEAQDLTPMQWRMVMRRVRGRSLTIVGDLAQHSGGPVAGGWPAHLPGELHGIDRRDLTINYRSPAEIHALAIDVLGSFAPDVEASRAIRRSGHPPEFRRVDDLQNGIDEVLDSWRDAVSGQIAVIAAEAFTPSGEGDERVRWLHPGEAKGLEFDAVVVVEPAAIVAGPGGSALLYIALTRATQRLAFVHRRPLPSPLCGAAAVNQPD